MTPPDFRRILTAMPRNPHWTAPSAGTERQIEEHRELSATGSRGERPRVLSFPPGASETLASDSREQFPDARRSAFDAWFGSYRSHANSTVDGLGYHQQALALAYLMSHDAVAA